MERFQIVLDTKERVEEYLRVMSRYEGNAELAAGHDTIDAKSALGLFSMDLSKPVEVTMYDEDDVVKSALEKFKVSQ